MHVDEGDYLSIDIVSTVIYEQSTRDMAFYIGGDLSLDEISRDSFRMAAKEVGIGESRHTKGGQAEAKTEKSIIP